MELLDDVAGTSDAYSAGAAAGAGCTVCAEAANGEQVKIARVPRTFRKPFNFKVLPSFPYAACAGGEAL
jgi:hypothetical protein